MTQASVTAYIQRAKNGGWLKSEPKIRKVINAPKRKSALEEKFESQLVAAGITGYVREHRFCERGWRMDFAMPSLLIAVECEGGIHSNGRHVRPKGFQEDARKYRRAAIAGWLVLRVTSADINDGSAIADLEKAIKFRREGVIQVLP